MKSTYLLILALIFSSISLTAQSRYQLYGEQLLDDLNNRFYDPNTGYYVESINSTTNQKSAPCFLWPAGDMIRALTWGSVLNSAKYKNRLQSYITRIEDYKNGPGYAAIFGGQRFFDDNAGLGNALSDVYQKQIPTAEVLNKSITCFNYPFNYRDANWGLPQTEEELGRGDFYGGAVNTLALNSIKLYQITGDVNYLNNAKTYHDKLNDYTIKLKDAGNHLFNQTSYYYNGQWSLTSQTGGSGAGFRAAQTTFPIQLAIELYRVTLDQKYITAAREMANSCLSRWYSKGNGLSEISYWGGSSTVVMLLDFYELDHDIKWYSAARDIVDFLIDKGRDNKGFYPTGDGAGGNWNDVRTGTNPPTDISLMAQANAALAILRLACTPIYPSTGLVTVYADCNSQGFSGGMSVGDYRLTNMQALGVKDNDISSITISEGYKASVFDLDNFGGAGGTYTATNSCLPTGSPNPNFNDAITSMKVRPNGTANLNGAYYIQNRASGLVMDVDGLSTADGAAIRQRAINNGLNQQFDITDLGDGSYKIMAKHSGKGLDVAGISTTAGGVICQWANNGAVNQNQCFILVPTDNGFYKIIAQHDGMVVEVSTNTDGEQLHQWYNHGGANAQWKFVQATLPSTTGLVTTYDDCNYAGFSAGLNIGDYNMAALKAKGIRDDAISSLKITQGYKAILYQDDNFTGGSTVINSDNSCLNTTWNDKVTSIHIRANGTTNLAGTYFIQNRASGLYIDVDGISTSDGAAIRQQGLNNGANQQFELTDRGDGSYSIAAKHSGKVLEVAGASTASGAFIQQWSYLAKGSQRFILIPTDNGFYKLIAEHDGMVAEVSTNNGGEQLHQWWNHNGTNAQWKLVQTILPSTGLVTTYDDCNYTGFSGGLDIGDYNMAALKAKGIRDDAISSMRITQGYKAILYQDDNFTGGSTVINSDNSCLNTIWNDKVTSIQVRANGDANLAGTYYMQNRNSGMYMDVWGISTADGANISQGSYNGGNNQQFRFLHLGDGVYQLQPVHSNKAVSVAGSSKDNGANVYQWTYSGTSSQQFVAVPTGDGFYKLVAKHSGRIVDVLNASTANGANVQQWDNNNQTAGQWKLVSVTTGRMASNKAGNYAVTPNGSNENFTHIDIYPNPTDGRLFFNTDMAGVKVSVFSSTGVLISEQLLTENTLDVSDLKSGFYLILFEKGSANIIQRFVKN